MIVDWLCARSQGLMRKRPCRAAGGTCGDLEKPKSSAPSLRKENLRKSAAGPRMTPEFWNILSTLRLIDRHVLRGHGGQMSCPPRCAKIQSLPMTISRLRSRSIMAETLRTCGALRYRRGRSSNAHCLGGTSGRPIKSFGLIVPNWAFG